MLYDVEQAVAEDEAFRERIPDNAVSWDGLTLVVHLEWIGSGTSPADLRQDFYQLLGRFAEDTLFLHAWNEPGSVATRSSPVTSAVTRSTRTTSGSGSRGLTWNSSYHRHDSCLSPDTGHGQTRVSERCFPSAARRAGGLLMGPRGVLTPVGCRALLRVLSITALFHCPT